MKSRTSPSVLETKLSPPQIYANTLIRPRLFQLMKNYLSYRLVVVAAPAGYGKSTFMTMWVKHASVAAAWVSLDEMDNDATRFWLTLNEAIMKVQPNVLRRFTSIIHFGGQPTLDVLTSALISDFREQEQDITIILDDYHVISNADIHRSIEYLIKYIPRHVHLVIISRSSLPFSLSRLRVQGQVLEIGIHELRFTPGETRDFYQDVLRMRLPEEVMTRVSQLTEGWISGLQLAAMVLHKEQKPSAVFSQFGGRHQLVAEFLNDEVLDAQPKAVQRFLLETSILNRMTESLCIAVTGIQETHEILQQLQFTNSFVMALDEQGHWFRYHHLFSDFLRHRLQKTHEAQIRQLHQRAANWFESQGFTDEAIEHAISAENFTVAARIMESNSTQLLRSGELGTLLHWFERIPNNKLEQYPVAKVLHGWVLALSNHLEPALQVIAEVQESLQSQRQQTQFSEDYLEEVTLELDVLRGYIAILQRHTNIAIQFFTASVEKSPKHSKFFLHGVNLNTGEPFVLPSRLGMRGYLQSAFELYTVLRQIWKHSGLAILGYGSAALGELYYEWNQLDELNYFIPRGMELGKTFQDAGILVPIHLLHAKYLRARGMRTEMWQSIDELENWLDTAALNGHWQDIVRSFRVRLWVEENRADEVNAWLDASWEKQSSPVTPIGEYQMITLARVLIYTKRWNAAVRLLNRLLHYAETEDRFASKIEILVLQTLLYEAQNDERKAMVTLRRAIQGGISERYQRTFIDEGEPLARLLRSLIRGNYDLTELTHEGPRYIQTLIDGIHSQELTTQQSADGNSRDFMVEEETSPIEPLTKRERQILDAIGLGLSNSDIAQQLGLSVGTVKLYTHKIYGKLGVKNRTQAAAKARTLNF